MNDRQLTLAGTDAPLPRGAIIRAAPARDFADAVATLILDAECARAYLALEANGVSRRAKLEAVCAEVRDAIHDDALDAATWGRWCRLAGLDVKRADQLACSLRPDESARQLTPATDGKCDTSCNESHSTTG